MTRPMTTHPALEALRTVLASRPAVVVGSAPLEVKHQAAEGEVIVAVNGGISSTIGLVEVWVVNSRSAQFAQWGPARSRLAQLMLKQGAGRDVQLAVLLAREPEAPPVTLGLLAKQRTAVGAHVTVQQKDRRQLECLAGGRLDPNVHDAMSAGVTAAALCLAAGAASVRLVGFSWDPGYAYLPGERIDARGHVGSDQRALVLLEHRYGAALVHTLPIPDHMHRRYAGGKDTMAGKTTPRGVRATPAKTAPAARPVLTPDKVRVQATRDLQFQGRRIKAGDVFTIERADFRARQMEEVTDEAPPADRAEFVKPFPFPDAAQVRRQIPGMPRNAEGGLPTVREIAGQVRVTEPGDDDQAKGDPAGSPLE